MLLWNILALGGLSARRYGPVTVKACEMANASGTEQDQRVDRAAVLAAGHALRRTIRYGIAGRPARAPGFPRLDVGDQDRKHVRELGGRFAQLRGHWACKGCRLDPVLPPKRVESTIPFSQGAPRCGKVSRH